MVPVSIFSRFDFHATVGRHFQCRFLDQDKGTAVKIAKKDAALGTFVWLSILIAPQIWVTALTYGCAVSIVYLLKHSTQLGNTNVMLPLFVILLLPLTIFVSYKTLFTLLSKQPRILLLLTGATNLLFFGWVTVIFFQNCPRFF